MLYDSAYSAKNEPNRTRTYILKTTNEPDDQHRSRFTNKQFIMTKQRQQQALKANKQHEM